MSNRGGHPRAVWVLSRDIVIEGRKVRLIAEVPAKPGDKRGAMPPALGRAMFAVLAAAEAKANEGPDCECGHPVMEHPEGGLGCNSCGCSRTRESEQEEVGK